MKGPDWQEGKQNARSGDLVGVVVEAEVTEHHCERRRTISASPKSGKIARTGGGKDHSAVRNAGRGGEIGRAHV